MGNLWSKWDQDGNVWFEWRQWHDPERGLSWRGSVPCHRINFSGISAVNCFDFENQEVWQQVHLHAQLTGLGLYPTFEIN